MELKIYEDVERLKSTAESLGGMCELLKKLMENTSKLDVVENAYESAHLLAVRCEQMAYDINVTLSCALHNYWAELDTIALYGKGGE